MAWHEVARNTMIILAAASLLVTLAFLSLVGWQLYKFAREFHEEIQPVIAAVQDTANTVRDTADYVGNRMVVPAADGMESAAQASGLFGLLRRFYTRV